MNKNQIILAWNKWLESNKNKMQLFKNKMPDQIFKVRLLKKQNKKKLDKFENCLSKKKKRI